MADAVVDASVWVSRFVTRDTHHSTSVRWLMTMAAGDGILAAPTLLLPEVAGPIGRITGRSALGWRAVSRILGIPGVRIVAIDRDLAVRAARMAADLRLRGADAVYVALAQALGLPLVTLDEEQLERGASVVTVQRPD